MRARLPRPTIINARVPSAIHDSLTTFEYRGVEGGHLAWRRQCCIAGFSARTPPKIWRDSESRPPSTRLRGNKRRRSGIAPHAAANLPRPFMISASFPNWKPMLPSSKGKPDRFRPATGRFGGRPWDETIPSRRARRGMGALRTGCGPTSFLLGNDGNDRSHGLTMRPFSYRIGGSSQAGAGTSS